MSSDNPSPPFASQPRQNQAPFLVLMLNRSVPLQRGHGPGHLVRGNALEL